MISSQSSKTSRKTALAGSRFWPVKDRVEEILSKVSEDDRFSQVSRILKSSRFMNALLVRCLIDHWCISILGPGELDQANKVEGTLRDYAEVFETISATLRDAAECLSGFDVCYDFQSKLSVLIGEDYVKKKECA